MSQPESYLKFEMPDSPDIYIGSGMSILLRNPSFPMRTMGIFGGLRRFDGDLHVQFVIPG